MWLRPREVGRGGDIMMGRDRWVRDLGVIWRGLALGVFRAVLRAWREALAFWLLS